MAGDGGKRRAGFALGILFAINLLNFFDRNLFGALAEPIRKEWSLTDAQVGALSMAFTLLYALAGVPLGWISDRGKRPRILAIGAALWSLLTAASGAAWSYASLFAIRLGVGIGEASCAPAANSLIGDFYPAKKRAWALGVFMLGLPLGNFLSSYVGGHTAAAYGWRMACYIACAPGLIIAAMALMIAEPERGAAEISRHAGRADAGSAVASALKIPLIPTMAWIIASGALFNFVMYTIGVFLPALLARYHHLSLKDANGVTAIVFGLVGIPGMLIGGWAADRAGKLRGNGRLLLAATTLLCAVPCMWLALDVRAGAILKFSLLMGAGCFLGYFYYGAVYAAIQDVVQPRLRGMAMAIYFFAMYTLGGSFGPVITGKLSDHFARQAMSAAGASAINEAFRAAGLHSALYVVPICVLGVSAVLFAGATTITGDIRKLQEWMTAPETREKPGPGVVAGTPESA